MAKAKSPKGSTSGVIKTNNAFMILGMVAIVAGINIIVVFVDVAQNVSRGWGIAFGVAVELAGALLIGMTFGVQKKRSK